MSNSVFAICGYDVFAVYGDAGPVDATVLADGVLWWLLCLFNGLWLEKPGATMLWYICQSSTPGAFVEMTESCLPSHVGGNGVGVDDSILMFGCAV